MINNKLNNPYQTVKNVHFATNGMVATSQYLASSAGIEILKQGGNAVDAAIATAACLTVVEPTSNGIGGDAFALIWINDKLHGLNASGPAPKNISIKAIKERGHSTMPTYGVLPVTVPGAVAAWATLSDRFGKLSLAQCLAPAISYAKNGYPISPVLGQNWERSYKIFSEKLKGDEYQHWFDTFSTNNRPPSIGEIFKLPNHAKTLEEIGKTNGESFYHGNLANKIETFFTKHNGYLTKDDLKNFKPQWVNPISINYKGYDIWELPPNGQGIVALMALGILKNFDYSNDALYYHQQIESIKQSFATAKLTVTDIESMEFTISDLLSENFLGKMQNNIKENASVPAGIVPNKGGTVYLATADNEGNMVSFIQSNYMGFGSGIVIPGTGIAMQNRGHDFSLDPSHINALEGGKRTYHTIIPGFITKNNKPIGSFGVMGGYMQPQGHVQVISNLIDKGLSPQGALDAPRWRWVKDNEIEVEHNFPISTAKQLSQLGHKVTIKMESGDFGRGQIILRDEQGVMQGGCESRTDSSISCW